METNWSSLHKTLSDATRRSVLELLQEREVLEYTEIMKLLNIANTGRLNYHLKVLGNLVSKDDEGRYQLTENGRSAANLLRAFPERRPNGSSPMKSIVSLVLLLLGGTSVAVVTGFAVFLTVMGAALAGVFIIEIGLLALIGVALVVMGVLTHKGRIFHSL